MTETIGKIIGWFFIWLIATTVSWGLIGYIGMNWDISSWPSGVRVGQLIFTLVLGLGWIKYAEQE